jgi:hypothetical protein
MWWAYGGDGLMRYWYDTEFLEDGRTIELISIGIVAEDGREYYAVNQEITRGRLNKRIRCHDWLMANVVPSLPKPYGDWNNHMPKSWLFDYNSPLVKPKHVIANEVREFLCSPREKKSPELWANYAAYDHVVLCQLWGRMIDLPKGMPMYTNDIQQEARRLLGAKLPKQTDGEHNALADARHCRDCWEVLDRTNEARSWPWTGRHVPGV